MITFHSTSLKPEAPSKYVVQSYTTKTPRHKENLSVFVTLWLDSLVAPDVAPLISIVERIKDVYL